MKLFPTNKYELKLTRESSKALSELENQTLSKEQFVTQWNNQTFIGKVGKDEFELIPSKKLIGQICVLKGKFEDEKGSLEIRTGKIFKNIFLAVTLFSFSGIITAIIQTKWSVIVPLVLIIIIARFVFLELGFRLVSKNALNKLTAIIGIKKLNKK